MKKSIIFTVLFLLVLSQIAFSQTATLNFQGVLRSQYGNAVPDGDYTLTFRIYTQSEGGTAIWTEQHTGANAVEVINGVFSVDLGSVTALNIGFDADYWVSTQVDDNAEMLPRTRLTTAPYAMALKGTSNKFPGDGNVGIGTVSPLQKLHVNGNIRLDQDYGILMGFDESNKILNDLPAYDTHRMRFFLRNEEVFSITRDYGSINKAYFAGDVDITGRTTLSSFLNFNDTNMGIYRSTNDLVFATPAAGRFYFQNSGIYIPSVGNNTLHLTLGDSDTGLKQNGDGELGIYTNNVERIRISGDGSMDILGTDNSGITYLNNTDYQAPSDGFVIVWGYCNGCPGEALVWVNNVSPVPEDIAHRRAWSRVPGADGETAAACVTCPVRKGEWWRPWSYHNSDRHITFIPFGN